MELQSEVTHREIYERLKVVEQKVDKLQSDTADVVDAFHAARGAFIVLDWLGKLAKPLLAVGALIGFVGVAYQNWRNH